MWDKKLNRVYQHVLRGLRLFSHGADKDAKFRYQRNLQGVISAEKATVVKSEKAWMRFRDAETNTVTTLLLARWGASPDTRSTINAMRLGLVQQRVSLLKEYEAFLYGTEGMPAHENDHDSPIDRRLKRALDRAQGEGEEFQAINTADTMWDQELNRAYRKLLHRCSNKEQRALVAAETAWLSYRDKDDKTIEIVIFDHGNPELSDDNAAAEAIEQIHLVKLRTQQLQHLDAMLNPRRVRSARSRSPRRRTL